MPNYLDYQKSVAKEFKAYENRVRNLIDNAHWGEDGRYKEIILMNYLKRVLPKNVSVGTGFVRNNNEITSQIDIIIYDNSFPLLFSEGDFIIAIPENVIGIIEVKTMITPTRMISIMEKANENGRIIAGDKEKSIFNGVFSFNCNNRVDGYVTSLQELDLRWLLERRNFNQVAPASLFTCINSMALGNRYFIKLWPFGQNDECIAPPHYSVYEMHDGLAFSYFLSNLQEFVIRKATGYLGVEPLPNELNSFLYPIPEGKETRLVKRITLINEENVQENIFFG